MTKTRHIIDPERLSETLELPWKHYEVSNIDEAKKDFDKGSYKFESSTKPRHTLSFHVREPNTAVIDDMIFRSITRVAYIPFKKQVVLESKDKESFSQVSFRTDEVRLHVGEPVSEYKKRSWCETFEEEQKEVDARKN